MKLRIGLKSGKEFEINNSKWKPEEIFQEIFKGNIDFIHTDNKTVCIRCSDIEYIEEIKEKKEINFNAQVEAKEFQKSLKDFQEYLKQLESFKCKDFI